MANASGAFSIKIEGLEELQRSFAAAAANYRPIFAQAMRNATQKLQNTGRDNIRKNGTTYEGGLAKGWGVREATAERGVVVESEKYGGVIEFGRRPGKFPPIAPLNRWAEKKLGVTGIGFVIARKIAEKGTKAQPFVEPALRADSSYILQQFDRAAGVLVKEMAR